MRAAPGSAPQRSFDWPLLTLDGETILPAGTILSGNVKAVTRVGFGVRHETAGLDLEFNQLTSSDGGKIPILARVAEVDNGA